MNITRLPSGSYRIRETRNGVSYSVTVKYKPKKFEAMILIEEKISLLSIPDKFTAGTAMQRYITSKEHLLSPATIKGYTSYSRKFSDEFKEKNIYEITLEDIQLQIDHISIGHSGKYVKNIFGLLSATFTMFRPEFSLKNITLPKVNKPKAYIPIDDDVKKLLNEIEGSEYEIAIALAAFGMRRSEICALTIDDLKDGYIIVNKTRVQNKEGKWVINTTNNKSDERMVYIPSALEEKIRKKGYIFKYKPDTLTRAQGRILKKLGLRHFTPHKLRHYYVSISHALNIPDQYILDTGGWKTDHVMKSVYRQALEDKTEEMKDIIVDHIGNLLS